MIFVVAGLVVVAIFYARRASLHASALERQLVALREQFAAYREEEGKRFEEAEEEVLKLAQSVAMVRPLVPYPKWRFDADWSNPDLTFQLRRRLWQYFNHRRREAPVTVPWHLGTRLCLYLGNDLSRQIFIGGCFDPNEFAFLDRFLRPGMTFVDAGANEGVYTVFAARKVGGEGLVWAFEPRLRELDRLRPNLDLNGLTARVFPLALAERSSPEGQNTLGAFSF